MKKRKEKVISRRKVKKWIGKRKGEENIESGNASLNEGGGGVKKGQGRK